MSKKNKKKNPDKISAKKAAVLGTEKKNRMPLFVGIAGVILIAGAIEHVVGVPMPDDMRRPDIPILELAVAIGMARVRDAQDRAVVGPIPQVATCAVAECPLVPVRHPIMPLVELAGD